LGITINDEEFLFASGVSVTDVDSIRDNLLQLVGDKIHFRRVGKLLQNTLIDLTHYYDVTYVTDKGILIPEILGCISGETPTVCDFVENNFAGVFIGDIICFGIYGVLGIHHIRGLECLGEVLNNDPCCDI
jgi:hypothetical protein